MKNLLTLDKKNLTNIIDDNNWFFLDIRPSESYNGWQLYNENLSGHIKNSTNFYYKWISNKNLLKTLIKEKNVNFDTNIVLCFANKEDLNEIVSFFQENNFQKIYILDMRTLDIFNKKFIINYPNYKNLIPARYIKNSSNLNDEFKIFHVGFGEEKETSKKGHILGSIYINTNEIEPPPLWELASKETLSLFGQNYDLHSNDKILISAWNQMASYRVATTLMYMGIKNVCVLDGGLESLESIGYEFETKGNFIIPNTSSNYSLNFNDKVITTTKQLKNKLKQKTFTLLDNRTWLEHIGKISGYSYYKKKARIPGSIYGYAGISGSHNLEYYRNPDNTMKCKKEIENLWLSQNINLSNELTFMCGSGWRASEIYFYAFIFGYNNISLYSDGWIGWSRNPSNPTTTGIPK
ncbi:MAG: sulfurtransferase [Sarcina sp.]